jgi:hypothetical protein
VYQPWALNPLCRPYVLRLIDCSQYSLLDDVQPDGAMNRYAFTFAIVPGTEAAVAGVLSYYLWSGSTLVKGDRILHILDTDEDLPELAKRLRGRSGQVPLSQALAPFWRQPDGLPRRPEGEEFLAATLMRRGAHHQVDPPSGHSGLGRAVDRGALLYPVRKDCGGSLMRLLGPGGKPDLPDATLRGLFSSTIFGCGDVVVRFWEAAAGADERRILAAVAPRPPLDAALVDLLDLPTAGSAEQGTRAVLASSTMTLVATSDR